MPHITILAFAPWRIKFGEDWVNVDKSTGTGTGEYESVNVKIASNMTSSTGRTATLFIESTDGQFNAVSVSISQGASSVPVLSKPIVAERGKTSAIITGEYYSESAVVEKGLYLSNNSDLTETNSRKVLDSGDEAGKIRVVLSGLNSDTQYYIRTFVKTEHALILSEPIGFKTLGTRPNPDDNPTPD